MKKYFGTDGIRGIVNKDLTPEFVLKLGRILAGFLGDGKGKIIVGQDTRISKDMLSFALQSGILSAGVDVLNVGIIPTAGIAYLVKNNPEILLGVMISASHNPVEYNGIKIFEKNGFKLKDNIEEEIERIIDSGKDEFHRPYGENIGRRIDFSEGREMYKDFLKNIVGVDLSGWRIMIDCANGAVSEIGPKLFEELGAEVIASNCNYDGININKNCGAVYPEMGLEDFKKSGAKIGFSYDGDGDRALAFAEDGTIVDGDKILGIIALYLKKKNRLKKDTVVGTLMTNSGLEKYLKDRNISLIRTKVGDRYILEEISDKDLNLGGEPSGHIILFDHLPTGDGLLTSLFLTKILKEENISLRELAKSIPQYPQKNEKIHLTKKLSQETLNTIENIIREVIKNYNIRYIVRVSGTEPILRITLEGDVPESLLEEYMKEIKKTVIPLLN